MPVQWASAARERDPRRWMYWLRPTAPKFRSVAGSSAIGYSTALSSMPVPFRKKIERTLVARCVQPLSREHGLHEKA